MRKPRNITEWVNGLNAEQMGRIYEMIDGPIPPEIDAMTDDELLAELKEPTRWTPETARQRVGGTFGS